MLSSGDSEGDFGSGVGVDEFRGSGVGSLILKEFRKNNFPYFGSGLGSLILRNF
jgi:hypothetical protein